MRIRTPSNFRQCSEESPIFQTNLCDQAYKNARSLLDGDRSSINHRRKTERTLAQVNFGNKIELVMWFSRVKPELKMSTQNDSSSTIITCLGQQAMVTMSLPNCPVQSRSRYLVHCLQFAEECARTAFGADNVAQFVKFSFDNK